MSDQKGFIPTAAILILVVIAGAVGYFAFHKIAATNKVEGTTLPSSASIQYQHLASVGGHVTIGPVCPHENINSPCPVPPELYASVKIGIFRPNKTTLVKSTSPDSSGNYKVGLEPGKYVVSLVGGNAKYEQVNGLPKTILLSPGENLVLDISIDTGLR